MNLILGRKAGQGIFVGRGITVTVVGVRPDGTVRVSVDAPKHYAVTRDDYTLEQHLVFQAQREADMMATPTDPTNRNWPHLEACAGSCVWCLVRILVAERLGSMGLELVDDVARAGAVARGGVVESVPPGGAS